MNHPLWVVAPMALALLAPTKTTTTSEPSVFAPDLTGLTNGRGCSVVNRALSTFKDGPRNGVRLDEGLGEGLVRFGGSEFGDGTIELDVRGKNVAQKSFLGVAFLGADDRTYDAIYFRPFNFKSNDPARRAHGVQYVSHPDYPWKRLRTEHPGPYENPVEPTPDPDAWFHVRVIVAGPKVSVFVNDAKQPNLAVQRLSTRKSGWVGFFVGDESGGDFANLRVRPAR